MPGRCRVDRDRIRELLAKGCSQKQVALRLGHSQPVVSRVVSELRQREAAKAEPPHLFDDCRRKLGGEL